MPDPLFIPIPAEGDQISVDLSKVGGDSAAWVTVRRLISVEHRIGGDRPTWAVQAYLPDTHLADFVVHQAAVIGWQAGPNSPYQAFRRHLDDRDVIDNWQDLVLACGGSGDSFIGRLLDLCPKAEQTPDHARRIKLGFPRLFAAWLFWRDNGPVTAADLYAHLDKVADAR